MIILKDLKDKNNLETYHMLKGRSEVTFNIELVIEELFNLLKNYINDTDIFIIPQSSSNILKDVLRYFDNDVIEIQKNDKSYIIEKIKNMELFKEQRKSLISKLELSDNIVKLYHFKAKQRDIVSEHLFKYTELSDGNYIILDDSSLTGNTLDALENILKQQNISKYSKIALYGYK